MITESFLPNVGGLEWKVHYLATEYVRRGHEVVVFTTRPYVTMKPIPVPVVPCYEVVRRGVVFPGMGRLGIVRRLIVRAILEYHGVKAFDVLHCHHLASSTRAGVMVKAKTGVPVVATTTGSDIQITPEMNYGERLRRSVDRMVRRNVREVDVIGSVSSAIRMDMEGLGATSRIVDIPNGVTWEDFQVSSGKVLQSRLGLNGDCLVVLSVGRNAYYKAYDWGIQAFARVCGAFPHAYYVLVGRGISQQARLVNELGLADRVRLVEQVHMSELPSIFHSADVFFNPSRTEGFAQVNAQALASGLPCVVTDAPGNVDAAANGGALVAQSGDIESMAHALQQLLADSELRRRMGQEAHAASKRYAWTRIADDYLAIFEELVGVNRGPRSRR